MLDRWSPHPRYRLYTSAASYWLPLRYFFSRQSRNLAAQLETQICRRFEVSAASCVPMARTGLYLALKELIRSGQTVVMSPLTIVDVVNMVLLAGGIPVFADIRRQSCAMDPDQAESLIDSRTGAVLVTHLHGIGAGVRVFQDICRRRGVLLIEDAAQAFGAIENGHRLGTIGDLGIFSFGFYKNVNTWRGGMLVSPDQDLIGKIRRGMEGLPYLAGCSLLKYGLSGLLTDTATWPPLFAAVTHAVLRQCILRGVQTVTRRLDPESGARRMSFMPPECLSRMTAAQAVMALTQLDQVDSDAEARVAHAAAYYHGLRDIGELIVPEWKGGRDDVYTYYPIQYHDREALLCHALRRRRDFAAQHLRNCADLPEFREFYRDCPNARAASRQLILLPTYPRYPLSEAQRNIEIIRDFIQH